MEVGAVHHTLRSVGVVLRLWEMQSLYHVENLIVDFMIDIQAFTVEAASRRGCPLWTKHLIALVEPPLDARYVAQVVNAGTSTAACIGDLAVIASFCELFPRIVIIDAPDHAAKSGFVHILDWLHSSSAIVWWKPSIHLRAVESGDLNTVKWVTSRFSVTLGHQCLLKAIEKGNEVITRHIWSLYRHCDQPNLLNLALARLPASLALDFFDASPTLGISIDDAASRGDLRYLELTSRFHPAATKRAMNDAAANGHIRVLSWLHHNRHEGCTQEAIDLAATQGHFEVVNWLLRHRREGFSSLALLGAATNGHLRILEFLHEMEPSVQIPASTFDQVCAKGHIRVAAFLTSAGLGGGSVNAMDWAAGNNHLSLLEWLSMNRDEGCTTAAMDNAAARGHLPIVIWLHDRGERCTTSAMDNAAGNGHLAVVEWLSVFRMEGCTTQAVQRAAESGNYEIVKWLHEHAAANSSGPAIDFAAKSGNIKLVQWLTQVRSEICSLVGMRAAAARGHLHILEYLRVANATVGCDTSVFDAAVEEGHIVIVVWIAANYSASFNHHWFQLVGSKYGWTDKLLHRMLSM